MFGLIFSLIVDYTYTINFHRDMYKDDVLWGQDYAETVIRVHSDGREHDFVFYYDQDKYYCFNKLYRHSGSVTHLKYKVCFPGNFNNSAPDLSYTYVSRGYDLDLLNLNSWSLFIGSPDPYRTVHSSLHFMGDLVVSNPWIFNLNQDSILPSYSPDLHPLDRCLGTSYFFFKFNQTDSSYSKFRIGKHVFEYSVPGGEPYMEFYYPDSYAIPPEFQFSLYQVDLNDYLKNPENSFATISEYDEWRSGQLSDERVYGIFDYQYNGTNLTIDSYVTDDFNLLIPLSCEGWSPAGLGTANPPSPSIPDIFEDE